MLTILSQLEKAVNAVTPAQVAAAKRALPKVRPADIVDRLGALPPALQKIKALVHKKRGEAKIFEERYNTALKAFNWKPTPRSRASRCEQVRTELEMRILEAYFLALLYEVFSRLAEINTRVEVTGNWQVVVTRLPTLHEVLASMIG